MSSIFGTFRRTKQKKHSVDHQAGTLTSSSGVFSSTPNLLKIDQPKNNIKNGHLPPLPKPLPTVNKDEGPVVELVEDITEEAKWTFESRRSNSAAAVPKAPTPKLVKKGSTSSMRSFMSMMNVMTGSLKRSKSIRKLGSMMNVSSPTSSPSSAEKRRSTSSSKSKSEEFLDTEDPELFDVDVTVRRRKNAFRRKRLNTEPGVISSESSSENSSVHSEQTNSIRAGSEVVEGSDSEEGEMEKNPAEIERKTNILVGTKKFNMDPKKGIEYLVEKCVFEYTVQEVARFLKEGYGLSKASIGNYLGERIDFNEEVLKSFVELHDFKNLILVQALRQFLWGFRLPGESQKISRMLDAFAERYCQNNPELFSTDTCSVLCYSIIMLNTELHNPNVKDKVSLDQFIKRNRGIEGGELISVQFMSTLYNSILTEPFKFPEEDGNDLMLTFFNPDYEGWLYKFGGRPKSWKRLWFILSNNCLYYFKFTTDKTPRGIIPLENILVRIPQERSNTKLFVMTLYKETPEHGIVDHIKTCKTLSNGATVPRLYPFIQLGTQDSKMRERWIRSINANHSMDKFYSDLTLKKLKAKMQQENKKMDFGGVRKSQISLPSSTSSKGLPLIPPQNSEKDPNKFFVAKNLSCISLVNPPVKVGDGSRARSSSESRLFEGRKNSLGVTPTTTLLTTPKSRSNSRSPVLRHKNRIIYQNHQKDGHVAKSALLLRPSPSTSQESLLTPQVQLRNDPAVHVAPTIFEKYKKLSMIQELSIVASPRSGSISSEGEDKNGNISNFSVPLDSTRCSTTSSSGTDDTEFEYKVLNEENSFNHSKGDADKSKESLEQLLSDDEDPPTIQQSQLVEKCSIQIIDCSNPNIQTKSIMPLISDNNNEEAEEFKSSSSCNSDTNESIPQMCFESIYESNV